MYVLYVLNKNVMAPIADQSGEKVYFKEEEQDKLKQHQEKSYAVGRPMWIIYINQNGI